MSSATSTRASDGGSRVGAGPIRTKSNSHGPMISIAYILELVAAVAAGLGLVRYAATVGMPFDLSTRRGWLAAWDYLSTGIALVGLLGMLAESARRRSPERWGFGRWTWAIAGLYAVAIHGVGVAKGLREAMFYLGLPWIYFYGLREAWPYLGPGAPVGLAHREAGAAPSRRRPRRPRVGRADLWRGPRGGLARPARGPMSPARSGGAGQSAAP